MAVAILTVVAGVIYIAYKYNEENRGVLKIIGISVAVICGLILLFKLLLDGASGSFMGLTPEQGFVLAIIILVLVAVFAMILFCFVLPDRWNKQEAQENVEILAEINKLPRPTGEELRAIKIANHIPTDPPDHPSHNRAALLAWQRAEYEKRLMERRR